ncbi:hypothetical protein CEUSTIGMA_g3978.t1 [Chlamydomonas eustigma]|uniref:Pre-mRNA polyadenylation factor Fip1 domain-containing protein n=1 Tax=Chlamydomonas eustigma TaxID=1157962 RepID=A0A250X0W8_9CHLO|nr:hypothetical protein CEUSTIGMA_g3978.t1 [Chlamydomonas eustigma]|eukprot:GAX76532.1 hypothetical protein CEUSTIGMA_g3978.t1 [Chlamydomonas eustigma]
MSNEYSEFFGSSVTQPRAKPLSIPAKAIKSVVGTKPAVKKLEHDDDLFSELFGVAPPPKSVTRIAAPLAPAAPIRPAAPKRTAAPQQPTPSSALPKQTSQSAPHASLTTPTAIKEEDDEDFEVMLDDLEPAGVSGRPMFTGTYQPGAPQARRQYTRPGGGAAPPPYGSYPSGPGKTMGAGTELGPGGAPALMKPAPQPQRLVHPPPPGVPPGPAGGQQGRPPAAAAASSALPGHYAYAGNRPQRPMGAPLEFPPDADIVFPSLYDPENPKSFIKLPRQTRVLPDEYKEFLSLGHGEIFTLPIDKVVDAPWRQPFMDSSSFFNYDMNESGWKEYQRKIQQYRDQYALQNKIEVIPLSGGTNLGITQDMPAELVKLIREAVSGGAGGENPYLVGGRPAPFRSRHLEPRLDSESIVELTSIDLSLQPDQGAGAYGGFINSDYDAPQRDSSHYERILVEKKKELLQRQKDFDRDRAAEISERMERMRLRREPLLPNKIMAPTPAAADASPSQGEPTAFSATIMQHVADSTGAGEVSDVRVGDQVKQDHDTSSWDAEPLPQHAVAAGPAASQLQSQGFDDMLDEQYLEGSSPSRFMSTDFMAMGYEDAVGVGDVEQGDTFEVTGGASWDAFEGEDDQDFVFGAAVTMDSAPEPSGRGSSHAKGSKHGKEVLDLLTSHAGAAHDTFIPEVMVGDLMPSTVETSHKRERGVEREQKHSRVVEMTRPRRRSRSRSRGRRSISRSPIRRRSSRSRSRSRGRYSSRSQSRSRSPGPRENRKSKKSSERSSKEKHHRSKKSKDRDRS